MAPTQASFVSSRFASAQDDLADDIGIGEFGVSCKHLGTSRQSFERHGERLRGSDPDAYRASNFGKRLRCSQPDASRSSSFRTSPYARHRQQCDAASNAGNCRGKAASAAAAECTAATTCTTMTPTQLRRLQRKHGKFGLQGRLRSAYSRVIELEASAKCMKPCSSAAGSSGDRSDATSSDETLAVVCASLTAALSLLVVQMGHRGSSSEDVGAGGSGDVGGVVSQPPQTIPSGAAHIATDGFNSGGADGVLGDDDGDVGMPPHTIPSGTSHAATDEHMPKAVAPREHTFLNTTEQNLGQFSFNESISADVDDGCCDDGGSDDQPPHTSPVGAADSATIEHVSIFTELSFEAFWGNYVQPPNAEVDPPSCSVNDGVIMDLGLQGGANSAFGQATAGQVQGGANTADDQVQGSVIIPSGQATADLVQGSANTASLLQQIIQCTASHGTFIPRQIDGVATQPKLVLRCTRAHDLVVSFSDGGWTCDACTADIPALKDIGYGPCSQTVYTCRICDVALCSSCARQVRIAATAICNWSA